MRGSTVTRIEHTVLYLKPHLEHTVSDLLVEHFKKLSVPLIVVR